MQDIDMKNLTVFAKHIRFKCDALGCQRGFHVVDYGDKQTALMAASQFERRCKSILLEFDGTHGFPQLRSSILSSNGLDSSLTKKSIRCQRDALAEALCSGKSAAMEAWLLEKTLDNIVDSNVRGRVHVQSEASGFLATFTGSHQKLEQKFKNLKSAVDWAIAMDKADQDFWVG